MADNLYFQILICLIAGCGAGLGTGFAGLSAAVVITPMLVAFLDIDFYVATAIALASDVLASAISAVNYGRKGNINFKSAIVMLVFVLGFTVLGSYLAKIVNTAVNNKDLMNLFPVITTLFMGLKFVIKPINKTKEDMNEKSKRRRIIESMLVGTYIGFVAGFVGAGGGMMLLFALTIVLGYELKTAVGTSVLIMTLTAAVGAGTHFIYIANDASLALDWRILVMCVIFTFVFAQVGSWIANRSTNKVLNYTTGGILIATSVVVLLATYVWPLLSGLINGVDTNPVELVIDRIISFISIYQT